MIEMWEMFQRIDLWSQILSNYRSFFFPHFWGRSP